MTLDAMVSAWMTDRPVTVKPDASVFSAYATMAERGIRHLLVVEGDRLVGIVSDRDLSKKMALHGARRPKDLQPLFDTPVSAIMTREGFVTATPVTTLAEAARLLVYEKVSALPVLDGDRLVGLVTTEDLLWALARFAEVCEAARSA
jgi:CBS domain-containing protein